MASTF